MPTEYENICKAPLYIETEYTTNAATTASLSPYSSVSPYLSGISSADTWTISFEPKERETTIKTEASFTPTNEKYDAEKIEECLRAKVAADLAKQLLDEDLIQIHGYTDHQVDGSTIYKMKAEVKIIQE